MSLTHKITSLLLAVLGLFFAVQFLIHHTVLRPSFDTLERSEAITDMDRCRDAIAQELSHLSTLCNDWACWDDSYRFVQGDNEAFIANSLTGDVLETAKLTILLYCDNAGQIIWKEAISAELTADEIWTAFPAPAFDTNHFLLRHETIESDIKGVMLVNGYALLVVSRPILTSNGEGPVMGSLIMGRLLDAELCAQLEKQTHVMFTTMTSSSASALLGQTELENLSAGTEPLLRVVDAEVLEVFTSIPFLNASDELILKADVPRHISHEGQAALTFAMLTFLITALAALLAIAISLRLIVLDPLAALSDHVTHTASTHDWTARLNTNRVDEFGRLSDELDGMVAALAAYHSAAHAMAHDAGRAELASGAVHDIGNAINSAGVCAHLISDLVRRSALPKLLTVSSLLHELREDPFPLDGDPERLATLSAYMTELTDLLLQERDDSLQELEALLSHIQRVVQVTQTQMSAVSTGVNTSETSIADIANMALAVSRPAFGYDQLKVEIRLSACDNVWLDRSKVLQIVTTLLPLAAHSVSCNPVDDRQVELSITPIGSEILRFEVVDNGMGHAAPDLAAMFKQHQSDETALAGFDLHHCALTAKAMGGTLTATSDGPGLGTTFTLDVPLVHVRSASEPIVEGARA